MKIGLQKNGRDSENSRLFPMEEVSLACVGREVLRVGIAGKPFGAGFAPEGHRGIAIHRAANGDKIRCMSFRSKDFRIEGRVLAQDLSCFILSLTLMVIGIGHHSPLRASARCRFGGYAGSCGSC